MQDAGTALMGIGYGTGDSRAAEAARAAVDSPLLDTRIDGAKGILFNITGGNDLSMFEVDEAARIITESADPDANIIFGAVVDDNFTGQVKVTVVATGFAQEEKTHAPASLVQKHLGAQRLTSGAHQKEGEERSVIGDALFRSTSLDLSEEELEVPAFMRKKVG